jgi:hypothetical protein
MGPAREGLSSEGNAASRVKKRCSLNCNTFCAKAAHANGGRVKNRPSTECLECINQQIFQHVAAWQTRPVSLMFAMKNSLFQCMDCE